jgi:GNAT superfamily N-acetyltransferase
MIGIRLATTSDASAVCEVLRRCIVECCVEDHQNDPAILGKWLSNKTPETIESWFAWPAHYPLVATVGNTVTGVAMLSRPGKIVLLYVDPGRRFSGIGSALLRELERKAKKSGVGTLRVSSTFSARGFYESHGYEIQSTTGAAYGMALAMIKSLQAGCGAGEGACGMRGNEYERGAI